MRRQLILTAVCLTLLACGRGPLPEDADGYWQARRPGGGDQIRLDLEQPPERHGHRHRHQLFFDLDEIPGLGEAEFKRSDVPLSFTWVRDAGTFHFDGTRRRRPFGSFRFVPSAEFQQRLDQMEIGGDALALAMRGVSLALLDQLIEAGYRIDDAGDLISLSRLGMDEEWLLAANQLKPLPTMDGLIQLARYGVRESELRGWAALNDDPIPIDTWLRLRTWGVTPERVARYRELGVNEMEGWFDLTRYDVPDGLIEAARELPEPFSVGQIVQLSIYDVSPEWMLRVQEASSTTLSLDQFLDLNRYDISAERYESYVALGIEKVSDVRTLSLHGVEPEFIERLRERGLESTDAQTLVDAQRMGIERFFADPN